MGNGTNLTIAALIVLLAALITGVSLVANAEPQDPGALSPEFEQYTDPVTVSMYGAHVSWALNPPEGWVRLKKFAPLPVEYYLIYLDPKHANWVLWPNGHIVWRGYADAVVPCGYYSFDAGLVGGVEPIIDAFPPAYGRLGCDFLPAAMRGYPYP